MPKRRVTVDRQQPFSGRVRPADAEPPEFTPERVNLFKVPLGCEAAGELGCGVKAKPILQTLVLQLSGTQAWLNRNGTILAVLWEKDIDPQVRGETVRTILAKKGLAARELLGVARESTLREFSAGAGWYRGDAVDRLSEQEAAIIAARLVRRVTAKVPLSDEIVDTVVAAVAEVCRHQLINRPLTSPRLRRQRIANEILKVGRKHLDGDALEALQEAAALGHGPIAGEK